jgi:hypothetical protein
MKTSSRPRNLAIVRSWGDEPVALLAYRIDLKGDVVFIGSKGCRRQVGLPSDQVFAFEEILFERLRSAHQSMESEKLLSSYACCIRYQDMVDSSLDQEHLTDPKRASESHDE